MDRQIYAGEWKIMEYLWAESPRTLMEIVRAMAEETGWAKSTVTTMVTRMEAKGLLRFEEGGRAKKIYPAVTREEAAGAETDSLLDKVYRGSASVLMSALVERKKLRREDIDELYALLRKAEEESQ